MVGSTATDALGHPLTLTITAFVLTGLLAPFVLQRAQDHRRKAERRAELAERVVGAVEVFTTANQFALVGAVSQTQEHLDNAYRQWQLDQAVIGTLLQAYYTDESVLFAWIRVRALATSMYVRIGIRGKTDALTHLRRKTYLSAVAAGILSTPPFDASDAVIDTPASNVEPHMLDDAFEHLRRVRNELADLARHLLTARMR